jgi:hypothetical protein
MISRHATRRYEDVIETTRQRLEDSDYYPSLERMPQSAMFAVLENLQYRNPDTVTMNAYDNDMNRSHLEAHGITGGIHAAGFFGKLKGDKGNLCVPWILSPDGLEHCDDLKLMTHAAVAKEFHRDVGDNFKSLRGLEGVISAFAVSRTVEPPLLLFEWPVDLTERQIKLIKRLAGSLPDVEVRLMERSAEIDLT